MRGRQYAGKAELTVQFEMAPFSEKTWRSSKESEIAGAAAFVQQALLPAIRLDLLPKSSIDVHIMVLDVDTSLLGCCALGVTAASAAIAEAGVQMLGLVVGASASAISTLSINDAEQEWLVDPSKSESAHSNANLLVCGMPSLNITTCYIVQGPVYNTNALKETGKTLTQVTTQHHSMVAQALFVKEK